MHRRLGPPFAALLFGGLSLSDDSAIQVALGLSLLGIAIALLSLVLVLRLYRATGQQSTRQVNDLESLSARAARLDHEP